MKNLKFAQSVLLDQLALIDKICLENNIQYWIDGGSLLGAVRNSKIIPWDDDIDICLVSEDYNKLIDILNKDKTNSKKFLYNNFRPFSFWSDYYCDTRVLKQNYLPYKLDIVRIKSIKNNQESIDYDQSMINIASFFGKQGHLKHKERLLPEHIEKFLLNNKTFKRSYFIKEFIKYAEREKPHPSNLFSYIYNDIYVKRDREYYTFDDIFPLKRIQFEHITVNCPNNTHSYLTKLYGPNYITPPEEANRTPAAKKIIKNRLPLFLLKANIIITYFLKEMKSELQLKSVIKKMF